MDKRYAVFDMDGTLTDSMGFWRALGRDYLLAQGVQPQEGLIAMTQTMTMEESARHFMDSFGLAGPPERIVAEMNGIMDEHYRAHVPLKPGMAAYLEGLARRGVTMCVATATAAPLAAACLTRLGVAGFFPHILSCEDIGVSKQRPDIYLQAAEVLGAVPADVAVYEDAPYALATAKRAGFYTVGVYEESYRDRWEAVKATAHEIITDWRQAL